MQYLDNILENNDSLNNDELTLETPIGWSSMCFDETIDYYIEYNSTHSNNQKEAENNNK